MDSPGSLLRVAATILGAPGGILMIAGVAALWRARPLSFALRTLTGMLLLTLGAFVGTIAIGIQGYRALTREDVAARLSVTPVAPQRFSALIRFADGREVKYELAGDEIYVDAHILKWKPLANLFDLRRRHAFLAPLLDADYGSATFTAVDKPVELELRISTTGLLLRDVGTN